MGGFEFKKYLAIAMRALIAERTVRVGKCLIWTGETIMRKGYIIPYGENRNMRTVAWKLIGGEHTPLLATTCKNPLCLEPTHIVKCCQNRQKKYYGPPVHLSELEEIQIFRKANGLAPLPSTIDIRKWNRRPDASAS